MLDKHAKESARITAASTLLDRGYGKPEQAMNIARDYSADAIPVQKMTTAEIYAMLRECEMQNEMKLIDGVVALPSEDD